MMRKVDLYLLYLLCNLLVLFLIVMHINYQQRRFQALVLANAELVRKLKLTDVVLFTEATYTRHPSQADYHTPFKDGPLTIEHFPSGSIILPPPHLRGLP